MRFFVFYAEFKREYFNQKNGYKMKKRISIILLLVFTAAAYAEEIDIEEFVAQSGFPGGLIVQINADNIQDYAKFAESGQFLVHGLYTNKSKLNEARANILKAELGGKITASYLDSQKLPFIDNVVNLLILEDNIKYNEKEVMRILAPRGKACLNGRTVTKSVPASIDDWTHNLYDASNNAVSKDLEAGPPRHLQWTANPKYCRSHDANNSFQAMVSSAGRVFYLMDEGSKAFLSLPSQWYLTARDGFNGKTIWKKKLPQALVAHLDHLKNGIKNLAHRIVASKDRVYVTMGFNAPVSALDSRTGKEIWVSKESANAEELILYKGILYCIINLDDRSKSKNDFMTMGAWNRLKANEIPRKILALDAKSGKKLWEHKPEKTILPLSMTIGKDKLFIHDGERIVAMDRTNGKQIWKSKPIDYWKGMGLYAGVTMVYYDDILLFSCTQSHGKVKTRKKENSMTGLDAETGEMLWSRPHRQFTQYFSPVDLMVADGLVWSAGLFNTEAKGKYVGIDPKTGRDVREFPQDPTPHMPHHRCHRNRGTEKYLFTGRTGVDLFNVETGKWSHDFWVRGSCRYGMMPANGMLYAPPNSCACYSGSMIRGLNALAPASDSRRIPKKIPDKGRLVKGTGKSDFQSSGIGDWPTFRGSPSRHGKASSVMGKEYSPAWKTHLKGKLSQPVISNGKVIVAAVNRHTIYALDEEKGGIAWSFLAGGKVNSPPTVWKGHVLFGCSDGWVYNLSLVDGKLIWKCRAAPEERRLIAKENLESPWPVFGSVLVRPDTDGEKAKLYCVAGRSMFLDGGLRMLVLDVASGRKIAETPMGRINPDTGKDLLAGHEWPPEAPTAKQNILSLANGKIYMGQQAFDLSGKREEVYYPDRGDYKPFMHGKGRKKGDTAKDHLFSTTGFLDGNQWHRGIWYFGCDATGSCWGVNLPAFASPSGYILSVGDNKVYGYGREFFVEGKRHTTHLFRCDRQPELAPSYRLKDEKIELRRENWGTTPLWDWTENTDVYIRAMVLASNAGKNEPDLLISAGAPDIIDEYDAMGLVNKAQGNWSKLEKIYQKQKAVNGKMGAKLIVTSTKDGKGVSETKLTYPPVFDGMAAANRKVFISDMGGNVVCLKATE